MKSTANGVFSNGTVCKMDVFKWNCLQAGCFQMGLPANWLFSNGIGCKMDVFKLYWEIDVFKWDCLQTSGCSESLLND